MNINYFMQKAIEQAKIGLINGETPIGAVLVDNHNNDIMFSSYNLVNTNSNAIQHAEMVVINRACNKIRSKYLNNMSIFITLEPCAMCAAAISESRIEKIYFGAYDEKKGSLESIVKLYNHHHYFVPEIYGGIEEKKCSSLLVDFFKNKRNK